MNWKSLLKILALGATFSFLLLAGMLFWGLSKLPSAFDIKSQLTPPALKNIPTTSNAEVATQSPPRHELPPVEAAPSQSQKYQKLKEASLKILTSDFMDERRPMVDACRLIEKVEQSGFFKDQKNASARYFFSHLSEGDKDPLSETAAPVFREVFRTPEMQQVMTMIIDAEDQNDKGLRKKAELYYHLSRAASALKNNMPAINQVLQQSYNMHIFMKAVAHKPELVQNPDAIAYCEEMEKNLNTRSVIDNEMAALNLQIFLSAQGISDKDIGYDPNYRSNIDMSFSSTQLSLNDSWIAQIFATDIEKAMQKQKK